jgi:tRNA pseudouridine38-40 synthase
MRHFKLTIEYDGTAYHGWQVQPIAPTVQGTIQAALARIAGRPVSVMGAGRTDAGVHALGQVASCSADLRLDLPTLRRALNASLPDDISIREVQEVAAGFDARRSAVARTYRYSLLPRETPSALLGRYSLWAPWPLSWEAMAEAGAGLLGTHDFSAFRAGTCTARSPVRTVEAIRWRASGECRQLEITANAFLQHMVRILVGSLLEVGRGRRPVPWLGEVLTGRDRTRAGKAAPPHGLCLVGVDYGDAAQAPAPGAPPEAPDRPCARGHECRSQVA